MRKPIALLMVFLILAQGTGFAQGKVKKPKSTSRKTETDSHNSADGQELTPIEIREAQPGFGKNPVWSYFHDGQRLDSLQQFKAVIDPLNDPQANGFLKNCSNKDAVGTVLNVLGGIFMVGGAVYVFSTTGATNQPSGGRFVNTGTTTPSDTGLGWVVSGAGILTALLGFALKGDGDQARRAAVNRYNELIGLEGSVRSTAEAVPIEKGKEADTLEDSAPVSLASKPEIPTGERKFGLGIGPLLNFPISSNTASEYQPAVGAGINISFALDKNLGLGFATGIQSFPINISTFSDQYKAITGSSLPTGVSISGGWTYFPVLGQVKYSLSSEGSGVTPYLFLGLGAAFNSADVSVTYNHQVVSVATSETDFLLSPGLGIGFHVDRDLEIFAQTQMDMNFTTQKGNDTITFSSINATASVNGNLSDDGPTLFTPIQVGIRYWQ